MLWIFFASQGDLDSLPLQPAGLACTVAHRPPHSASTTPTSGSTGGKGRENGRNQVHLAQAPGEHTGNEITD